MAILQKKSHEPGHFYSSKPIGPSSLVGFALANAGVRCFSFFLLWRSPGAACPPRADLLLCTRYPATPAAAIAATAIHLLFVIWYRLYKKSHNHAIQGDNLAVKQDRCIILKSGFAFNFLLQFINL